MMPAAVLSKMVLSLKTSPCILWVVAIGMTLRQPLSMLLPIKRSHFTVASMPLVPLLLSFTEVEFSGLVERVCMVPEVAKAVPLVRFRLHL